MAGRMSRRSAMKVGAAGALAGMSGCAGTAGGLGAAGQAHKGKAPKAVAAGAKIRVGMIGLGGRGRGAHLASLLKIPDVEVVAICDPSQDSIKKALDMMKDRKKPDVYDKGDLDYKRMLERDDIHAVTQATPCNWHAQMFIDTMVAGKHHYAEKPLGIAVKELDDCCATAKANPKLIVTMGFQWMYNPRFIEAVERTQAGEIGDLVECRIARHNGASPLMGWFSHRKTCGDWMLEQACHEFNVVNWITKGHPLKAFAIGRRDIWTSKDPGRNVTDFYSAVLEYPNHVVMNYSHDWHSVGGLCGMDLKFVGSKGGMDIFGGNFWQRGKKDADPIKAPGVNDTQEAFNTWVKCIKEGKQPLASPEYGRLASQLGLMLRKSIDENGKVVTYEEMLKTC
ncbi:MAG: Gfo/Idh/MocA family oxidoreductase [Phycisphaerae bacterium]|nr:Gfo/Idh/MocA family oxidoreductase [Phycisphaerae bacterium]